MGAWGTGNFENDTAMDWMHEFIEQPSAAVLSGVFKAVAENDEFIDADEGAMVLVAAEIIAALRGKKSSDYPDDMQVSKPIAVNHALIDEALKAVTIVSQSDESELKQLWQETDAFEKWNAVIDDLKSRMR